MNNPKASPYIVLGYVLFVVVVTAIAGFRGFLLALALGIVAFLTVGAYYSSKSKRGAEEDACPSPSQQDARRAVNVDPQYGPGAGRSVDQATEITRALMGGKEAAFMAPQWLRIASDSAKLVNTTTNPEVFFLRYDLLVERSRDLASIEHLVRFQGTPPRDQLSILLRDRDKETRIFILRSFERLKSDLGKLKTKKGKLNRIDRFLESFNPYGSYLSDDSKELFSSMSSDLRREVAETEI